MTMQLVFNDVKQYKRIKEELTKRGIDYIGMKTKNMLTIVLDVDYLDLEGRTFEIRQGDKWYDIYISDIKSFKLDK